MPTDITQCRVFVSPASFKLGDPGVQRLLESTVGSVVYNTTGARLSATQLKEMLKGVDGYIAGIDEVTAEVIASTDRLKVISRYGVGVDNIDLEAARRKGIIVTNTPGANAASVAELAIGLALDLTRGITAAIDQTRRGGWPPITGVSLKGKTFGIVGLGAVGRELALRLKGFEVHIVAYDPFPSKEFAAANGISLKSLDELLAVSDLVSLHLPATDETRGMVNAGFLARMKRGAFLINTARGELVDEEALKRALDDGTLGGAGLDVLTDEPPLGSNPLLADPRVIVTPHMAAHTDDAMAAMGRMATQDCLAVLRGETPSHRVV
ncbi:MAG: phosphoglycerate dehydrogenase [Candidatus Cryosericum sp.]